MRSKTQEIEAMADEFYKTVADHIQRSQEPLRKEIAQLRADIAALTELLAEKES